MLPTWSSLLTGSKHGSEKNSLSAAIKVKLSLKVYFMPCAVHLFWSRCGLCEHCPFPSCLGVRFSLTAGGLLAPTRTPYCGFSCLPPRLLLLLSSAGFLWCVSHVPGCVPPLVFALAVDSTSALIGAAGALRFFLRVPTCGPRLSRDPALAYRAFLGGGLFRGGFTLCLLALTKLYIGSKTTTADVGRWIDAVLQLNQTFRYVFYDASYFPIMLYSQLLP